MSANVIAWAQCGDHAAFEVIYGAYQGPIFNYLSRLMSGLKDGRELAAELTQDTFLKAYLALPKTSDDLRLQPWLYRIATNVWLDLARHRKLVAWASWDSIPSLLVRGRRADPDRAGSPVLWAHDGELHVEVQAMLNTIHPKYRLCLLLREYQGLTYDEIAAALHTTRSAVKSLLWRGREEIRRSPVGQRLWQEMVTP